MAAAFIPLIASVAPEIISLIAGMVHKHAPIIQANNGPNTGPVKLASLLTIVRGVIQQAIDAKTLPPGSMPSDDILYAIVQTGVSMLKLPGGSLSDTPATPPQAAAVVSPSAITFTVVGGTLQVTQS